MKIWKLNQADLPADLDPLKLEVIQCGTKTDPETMWVGYPTQPHVSAVEEPIHKTPEETQSVVSVVSANREDRPDLKSAKAAAVAKLHSKQLVDYDLIFSRLRERNLVQNARTIVKTATFPSTYPDGTPHPYAGDDVEPHWEYHARRGFKRDDPDVIAVVTAIVKNTNYTVDDILG
jgi:hypothetical protein